MNEVVLTEKENELIAEAKRYGISDELELAYLLGQCAYESNNFSKLEESLNYSSEALLATWPDKFTVATANTYGRNSYHEANQRCIGNIIYGDKLGNLPFTNDGFIFRGRGYLQLTGRDNYQGFNIWLQSNDMNFNVTANPSMVESYTLLAALSSVWFWIANSVGQLALKGDIEGVTKVINGGLNGLQARKDLTEKYIQLLSV